jgi:hypothetical protein
MGRFFLFFLFISLTSCKDARILKYEHIVQEATKFEIVYNASDKTITIPEQQIGNFKDLLIRNIKPELQRKFINDVRIDIFRNNQKTAFLMITNGDKEPFANFNSDGLNFGFRLPYGIGQILEDLFAEKSR